MPSTRCRVRSGEASGPARPEAALASAPSHPRRNALLGCQQPPPAWLTPLVDLDLDPIRDVGLDLRERDRSVLAGQHGHDLGSSGKAFEGLRQGGSGTAPGYDLVAGGDGEHPRALTLQSRSALGDLLAHVGDIEVGDLAGPLKQGYGGFWLVGVDVDLERHLVADNEHRVTQTLQTWQEVARGEAG